MQRFIAAWVTALGSWEIHRTTARWSPVGRLHLILPSPKSDPGRVNERTHVRRCVDPKGIEIERPATWAGGIPVTKGSIADTQQAGLGAYLNLPFLWEPQHGMKEMMESPGSRHFPLYQPELVPWFQCLIVRNCSDMRMVDIQYP